MPRSIAGVTRFPAFALWEYTMGLGFEDFFGDAGFLNGIGLNCALLRDELAWISTLGQ